MATNPYLLSLYEAIEALPEGYTGEIVDGQLHAHPRPAGRHVLTASALGADLFAPYHRGRGGPGGWWILVEPEVHFVRNVELVVPDVAGWRRERMPRIPDDQRFEVVPDWVCEIASRSTSRHDREVKMPLYARFGVPHVWLIDPAEGALEVFALQGDGYALVATVEGEATIRQPPFEDVALDPPWSDA